MARDLLGKKSGLLLESLRPIFGLRKQGNYKMEHSLDDLILAKRMKKKVGVIFHGSDIRDIDSHIKRNPYSPFTQGGEQVEKVRQLANQSRQLIPELVKRKIPIFVSTVDLLHELPQAHWLPTVIDLPTYEAVSVKHPPLKHEGKIRVLYLPSKSWIKSSELVIPVLEKLSSEGVIEWINWLKDGPINSDLVPEIIAKSDLVIDQFLGVIGVLPLEALAAGRAVMTYVPDELEGNNKNYPIPPVINVNPNTLENEIRKFAANPKIPRGGFDFVKRWHDGHESVKVLREVLYI